MKTSVVMGILALSTAGAFADRWTDNFNSYGVGSNLNGQGGWSDASTTGTAYKLTSGGIGGGLCIGPSDGSWQMNWTGHMWNWANLGVGDKVVVGMDFQTTAGGQFDDDRVGWVMAGFTDKSAYHFGVQLDNADNGGGGLVTYFRDNGGNRVNLSTLMSVGNLGASASAWYREQLTVTKLTSGNGAGGAKVDVTFWALDSSGNPIGTGLTASYGNIDTSALRGFSGDVYPMFKNFGSTAGGADNAYFEIMSVPEPASLGLFSLGALAFVAYRRRKV